MAVSRWWVALAVAGVVWAGAANAAVYTEGFESGYPDGSKLADHADWWGQAANPTIEAGHGVGDSVGLGSATDVFHWTAHPFSWNAPGFTGVVIQMDFETAVAGDANFPYSDDRLGWTIKADSTDSGDQFGLNLSKTAIEGYWRNATTGTKTAPVIATLPTLSASTWYRFTAMITKLTNTSAQIDVSLTELDSNGNPLSVVVTGQIADTSLMANPKERPAIKYFEATEAWAMFKNYDQKASANADNAYLEIIPEPTTMMLLLGGAALVFARRRRR